MTFRSAMRAALAIAVVLFASPMTRATTIGQVSVVDLIQDADVIIVGTVESVTEGTEPLPYTAVTVTVRDSLKGEAGETFTFRQLGTQTHGTAGQGQVLLTGAPPSFPTYQVGQEVLLFMSPVVSATGFRVPVGLVSGRFAIANGVAVSGSDNRELFAGVRLGSGVVADADDARMVRTTHGPIDADDFVDFVRRAVAERWTQTGRLTNAR